MGLYMKIEFMHEAVRLSTEAVRLGKGGPFGCVVVKDENIIGRGANQVTTTYDPPPMPRWLPYAMHVKL